MDSLNARFVDKYFGPDLITDVALSDHKTPSGGLVFSVTFKNGKTKLIPERTLVAVSTEEIQDLNFIRDRIEFFLVNEIANMVEEYDVNTMQIPHLMDMVTYEVSNRINRAQNWLWTKDDSRFTPGFQPLHDVSLLMARRIVDEIPKDEPTK
jgi:hypothetical protein